MNFFGLIRSYVFGLLSWFAGIDSLKGILVYIFLSLQHLWRKPIETDRRISITDEIFPSFSISFFNEKLENSK
jgi:hypothetical protein